MYKKFTDKSSFIYGLLKNGIVSNILTLSGAQILGYIFPLITLPYLARVLGPSGFGILAFSQSFAFCISLPVEFGFQFSGARMISYHRDEKQKISEALSGIIGAKIIFSSLIIIIAYIIHDVFPVFRDKIYLLWASVFFGIAFSSTMQWYYEGLEKMRIVAILDIFAKAQATICIFIFIRSPSDVWKVLALQGLAFLTGTVIVLIITFRKGLLKIPRPKLVIETIKAGSPMFLFRGAESFYQLGTAFLLGIFAPPIIVGYYSGAERIVKNFVGLILPFNRALFPRMSNLVNKSKEKASKLLHFGLFLSAGSGLLIFLIINLTAPVIVSILLGQQFKEVIPILRILSLLPFIIALKHVFGFQWLVAMGMDRPFNVIIILSGFFNLLLIFLLVPLLYQYGMALALILTETSVVLGIILYLNRKKFNPIFIGKDFELKDKYHL